MDRACLQPLLLLWVVVWYFKPVESQAQTLGALRWKTKWCDVMPVMFVKWKMDQSGLRSPQTLGSWTSGFLSSVNLCGFVAPPILVTSFSDLGLLPLAKWWCWAAWGGKKCANSSFMSLQRIVTDMTSCQGTTLSASALRSLGFEASTLQPRVEESLAFLPKEIAIGKWLLHILFRLLNSLQPLQLFLGFSIRHPTFFGQQGKPRSADHKHVCTGLLQNRCQPQKARSHCTRPSRSQGQGNPGLQTSRSSASLSGRELIIAKHLDWRWLKGHFGTNLVDIIKLQWLLHEIEAVLCQFSAFARTVQGFQVVNGCYDVLRARNSTLNLDLGHLQHENSTWIVACFRK